MTKTRSFALLCGVGLFAFISYNLVRMPLLPLFANSLGARPEMIGFIVSASTLTGVFLKWPAGALSDIYDRRWLLLAGLLAFALPPFVYLFISDVGWLIVLRFLHGMATAVFAPIALAVVADLYRETRGVALGSYTAATQAGAMAGPLLGGWVIQVAGFSTAFVIAGAMGSTLTSRLQRLSLLLRGEQALQPGQQQDHDDPGGDGVGEVAPRFGGQDQQVLGQAEHEAAGQGGGHVDETAHERRSERPPGLSTMQLLIIIRGHPRMKRPGLRISQTGSSVETMGIEPIPGCLRGSLAPLAHAPPFPIELRRPDSNRRRTAYETVLETRLQSTPQ